MNLRMVAAGLLILIILAAIVYFTYTSGTAPPTQAAVTSSILPTTTVQNAAAGPTNGTVGLANDSTLNNYNGTASNNASISNSTLNGNVTKDQNYSVLSGGNTISPP